MHDKWLYILKSALMRSYPRMKMVLGEHLRWHCCLKFIFVIVHVKKKCYTWHVTLHFSALRRMVPFFHISEKGSMMTRFQWIGLNLKGFHKDATYSKNVLKWQLALPSISIHACTPSKKAILGVFLNFGKPR